MTTTVNHIMTKKLVTVGMGASVHEAQDLMQTKRIRHLPVVDEMDDIVGVVSATDLANLSGSEGPIENYMSTPVAFIDSDTPLRTAAFMMIEKKISSLLVGDGRGDCLGIITTDDMLWYLTCLLRKEPDSDNYVKHLLSLRTLGEVARELGDAGI